MKAWLMQLLLISVCVGSSVVLASQDVQYQIKHTIEKRLLEVLKERLNSDKFYLDVSVKLKPISQDQDSKGSIPFLPNSSQAALLSWEGTLQQVSQLSLTLYVDRSISRQQYNILKLMIQRSLEPLKQEIKLTIKPMNFPKTAERMLLENKILELQSREQQLLKERNDLKQELIAAKSALEQQLLRQKIKEQTEKQI